MQTITLKIDEKIKDKFLWLIYHFSKNEVKILEQSEFISDDEYLRSIDGMVQSLNEAISEPLQNGVPLENLDW
jgi:hypothetical protein